MPKPDITSVRSERVTFIRKLRKRSFRAERGLFVVEGPQACREALASDDRLETLFVSERVVDDWRDQGATTLVVSDSVMTAMSETETPQGVIAVCRHLDVEVTALPATLALVIVVDRVSDPGNAGTIIRIADAVAADAVVFTAGSVDVYNGKCVRSSAGSIFHVPIVVDAEVPQLYSTLRDRGLRIRATSGRGAVSFADVDLAVPTAWVIGSEAHGLSDIAMDNADEVVAVPIFGQAESLNAAVTAAVVAYGSALSGPKSS